MKIKTYIIATILSLLALGAALVFSNVSNAQLSGGGTIGQLEQWRSLGGYLVPRDANLGLKVPGLATSTTGCLSVASDGIITANGSACGSGSGSGFSTTSANYWKDYVSTLPGLVSFGSSTATTTALGNLTAIGYVQLGTTTTAMLNGTVYIEGTALPRTSTGISAALTYLPSTGGKIVPTGAITMTDPINLTDKTNVTISCQPGTVFSIPQASLGNFSFGYMLYSDTVTDQHITIENCIFDGGYSGYSAPSANQGGGVAPGGGWTLTGNTFKDFNYFGLWIGSSASSTKVLNNNFIGPGRGNDTIGGGTGHEIEIAHNIFHPNIAGNMFDNVNGSGYFIHHNINLSNKSIYIEGMQNITIENNDMKGGGSIVVQSDQGYNPAIVMNSNQVDVLNNTLIGGNITFTAYASSTTLLANAGNFTARGNHISSSTASGILVHAAGGVPITGWGTGYIIDGNHIANVNTAGNATQNTGFGVNHPSCINVMQGIGVTLTNNTCTDNNVVPNTIYGIEVGQTSGASATNEPNDVFLSGNTAYNTASGTVNLVSPTYTTIYSNITNATTTVFSSPITVASTTASSTFANGINLTGGCFSIAGVCIGGSLTGGTANMLTAWTSASGLTATGTPAVTAINATSSLATSTFAGGMSVGTSSNFIVDLTKGIVGIGKYPTLATLDLAVASRRGLNIALSGVRGNSEHGINITDTSSGGPSALFAINDSNTNSNWSTLDITSVRTGKAVEIKQTSTGAGLVVTHTGGSGNAFTSSVTGTGASGIFTGGNVGIGTTSPYAALSVVGSTGVVAEKYRATSTTATSTVEGVFTVGTTTPSFASMFAVGTSTWTGIDINKHSGKIGFGCINNSPALAIFGCGTNTNVNTNIKFMVQDASDARMGASAADQGTFIKSSGGLYAFDYALGQARTLTLQEFGGPIDLSLAASVKQHKYPSFSWPAGATNATTTTATTTIPLGTAYVANTYNSVECWTGAATTTYQITDGTNKSNTLTATTSVSRYSFSSNNTFVASERRFIDVGPLTASYISCSFDVTEN